MKLYIFPPSPNSKKVMMVNALTGLNAEEVMVNLQAGEQKEAAILALNPNGRIPVMELADGSSLWESNAIINQMAAEAKSDLWPVSNQRYDILRWQFWEACHWTPICGKFISRHLFGNEGVDLDAATSELMPFAKVLDDHLSRHEWLSGDGMTTADISVSAIMAYRDQCQFPLAEFAHIKRWIAALEGTEAWAVANRQKLAA